MTHLQIVPTPPAGPVVQVLTLQQAHGTVRPLHRGPDDDAPPLRLRTHPEPPEAA